MDVDEKDKLPPECLKCALWKVGDYGTPTYGVILCIKSCPYLKGERRPKGGLNRWLEKPK